MNGANEETKQQTETLHPNIPDPAGHLVSLSFSSGPFKQISRTSQPHCRWQPKLCERPAKIKTVSIIDTGQTWDPAKNGFSLVQHALDLILPMTSLAETRCQLPPDDWRLLTHGNTQSRCPADGRSMTSFSMPISGGRPQPRCKGLV